MHDQQGIRSQTGLRLVDAYQYPNAVELLWALLGERQPHESISHRRMPSYADHAAFVISRPYSAWDVIEVDGEAVGTVYLTQQDEIGVSVLKSKRGNGYARQAIKELIARHPRDRYLANINPLNTKSQALFLMLGFRGPIQATYEL
jgi:RimJ/RimL family protein N-acetyltransferase